MHSTHTKRSDYASALRNWLEYFPKNQLLILDYNDVERRPRELLKEVFLFLGVDGGDERCDVVDPIDEEEIRTRFNAAASDTQLKRSMRVSLQKKVEAYLEPYSHDFNLLLEELGYDWRLATK